MQAKWTTIFVYLSSTKNTVEKETEETGSIVTGGRGLLNKRGVSLPTIPRAIMPREEKEEKQTEDLKEEIGEKEKETTQGEAKVRLQKREGTWESGKRVEGRRKSSQEWDLFAQHPRP